MLLKAPYIITLEGPVLKDHAILVEGEQIRAIGPQKDFTLSDKKCVELPNTVLSPGFVNAHCHLELSRLPGPLPYPGSFVRWIEALSALKLQMSAEDTQRSIRSGIEELLHTGTTTVLDHLSITTSPKFLLESVLEGIIYIEVMGVEEKRAQYFLEEALKIRNQWPAEVIITPHAPYSLLPEIFSKIATNHQQKTPLSIHISESAEEYLLFKERTGPLADFLETKGKIPPTKEETPLAYLHRQNLLPQKTLAVHANYLEDEDIAILKEKEMSVIHCPSSHAYFEHDRFPLGLLQDEGINIALGTDSKASGSSLSMLEQMRLALDQYSELTPEQVLKMATLCGAKAIGRENKIGSLKEKKLANIIGIPLRSSKMSPFENVIEAKEVNWMMIQGQISNSSK